MALNDKLKAAYAKLGVTDEQFAKLEEVFTDAELQEKLAGGYMMNEDYTHKTQELAEQRRAFQREQEEFNQGRNYLDQQNATWRTDIEGRLNNALKEAAEQRLYGAALKSKLDALAAQYGEDVNDLLKDVQAMRAEPKEEPKAPDFTPYDERFVDRKSFGEAADRFFSYPTQLRDFEREYERTFGKPYDGSLHDLVTQAGQEVQARAKRGVQANLWDVAREKLDFKGQTQRNTEAQKVAAEKEKEDWRKQTREEVEREVRSQYLAQNPNAARTPDQSEAWRANLSAQKRQQSQQAPERTSTPQDDFARRQKIHAAYEERAAQRGAA